MIGPAKEHYRCFQVYNPKTKGTAIADTLQWSESNQFQVPKITSLEQLTVAASDLATTIKQKNNIPLPDDPICSKINELCDVFKKETEGIILKKLKPIKTETYLNKRVIDETNPTNLRVTNEIATSKQKF